MAVAQRGQAERAVRARVFLVADAHKRRVEQAHDRRQHGRAARRGADRRREVGLHALADARQRGAELEHAIELVLVLGETPLRVVAVLLAAARVASGRLQVAVRQRADPDLLVRRRDRQRADARRSAASANALAVGCDVGEAVAVADAPDPRHVVADPDESARRVAVVRRRRRRDGPSSRSPSAPSRRSLRRDCGRRGRSRLAHGRRRRRLRIVDRRRHALRVLRRRRQRRRRQRRRRLWILGVVRHASGLDKGSARRASDHARAARRRVPRQQKLPQALPEAGPARLPRSPSTTLCRGQRGPAEGLARVLLPVPSLMRRATAAHAISTTFPTASTR